ncbi:MAG: stage II sporulation protein M [Thiotrichales bacterium]
MTPARFVRTHSAEWDAFEAGLNVIRHGTAPPPGFDLPADYRRLSHQLALARTRGYGPALTQRLETLALRAHQHLYQPPTAPWRPAARFFGAELPRRVRAEWRVVLLASLVFFGTLALAFGVLKIEPDLIFSVLDPEQVATIEDMYAPDHPHRIGRAREATTDIQMFGFYIRNNTSIGFQTFAGGLLFGLGTLASLLVNAVYIGAVAGHLTLIGHGQPFWSFVSGHSAPELVAIVLSGAAGFKLAVALLRPGHQRRRDALREHACAAIPLVYGAALLFVLAAYIEAFWSAHTGVPSAFKYAVGGASWAVLLGYFGWVGRR